MNDQGLSPEDIGIEILETVIYDGENDQVVPQVRRLHELGFNIELDDFGSGHASLSALTELPVNRIKIDQSLVRNVESDSTNRVILKMLIDTARELNIEPLAEGLETKEQVEIVSEMGIDIMQGYYFAQSMSCSDLEGWLSSEHLAGMQRETN